MFLFALVGLAPTAAIAAPPTIAEQVATARESGVWVVQPGQFLIAISEWLSPYNRARRRALQASIFARNPAAFRPGDRDFLLPGSRLAIEFPLEEVGRIEQASGEVEVRDINRRPRDVHDGDPLYLGDHFHTGVGSARLRFSDGARIELRPRTLFEIYDYQLPANGEPGVFQVRVLEGGVHSVSGAIGKQAGSHYRLQTPVINLGVRGTDYAVVVCGPAGCLLNDAEPGANYGAATYVGVREGSVGVNNASGSYPLERGQCLKVESSDHKPDFIPPPRGLYPERWRVRASCPGVGGGFGPCP